MLCLLPLMLEWARMKDGRKLRTWAAMMGASLAAMFAPFVTAFVVIDIIAAAVVLKRPASCAQRMIGLLFVGMVFFELGYLISPRNQHGLLMFGLQGLGWMQFAILAAWGCHDVLGYYLDRRGTAGSQVAAERRI